MTDFFSHKFKWLLLFYFLLLAVWAVFSYSLTAPNLILSNWSPYWQFQTWMWKTFFNNRQLLSYSYLTFLVLLFILYFKIITTWPRKQKIFWWLPLLVASPLLLSNNALSYDVFNYIFNAKMIIVYRANPHLKVALDFASDDWTRFMHNTHTPAPYFYGWTALSLLPYILGLGKFLLTWVNFRVFSFISFGLLSWLVVKNTTPKQQLRSVMLLLNPLLLIEVMSSAHNDLWMMVPAMASILLIVNQKTKKQISASLLLLIFSISIKLATLVLIPLWLALVIPWRKLQPQLHHFTQLNWAFLASVALFLPLLTPRSKQFLPWYLIWSLLWLPWIGQKWKIWSQGLILLSVSSMLRYFPHLLAGNYDGDIIWQQKIITWGPLFGLGIFLLFKQLLRFVSRSATIRK